MLVKCLSFVSAKDQLSIIRACRHLRARVISEPSLWTWVDRIEHPTALSFVLDCAKSSAVDITNMRVVGQNDDMLQVVASHMHHMRILSLYIDCSFVVDDHAAFTTPAPLLQRLSFHKAKSASFPPSLTLKLNASNYPRLYCFQLYSMVHTGDLFSELLAVESLRIISLGKLTNANLDYPMRIFDFFSNITTMNIELANWGPISGSFELGLASRRINIRWTKPGCFNPRQALPSNEAWDNIQAVHIVHVGSSLGDSTQGDTNMNLPLATEIRPYRRLWVRSRSLQVHARTVHEDGRERVFCGFHPSAVAGIATRIPGLELTTLTVATTAVALNVLSNSTWTSLSRIHLVSDTYDTAWVSIFARDMFNVPKLEHLEFSIEWNAVTSWPTDIIIRVLGCCIAAGHYLQKVAFLGFSPDSHCITRAEAFAKEIVVDRYWRELESERVWLTERAFEW